MRGLWLASGELSYRDDLPAPQRSADEVLVRVSLTGVCGTDLGLARGMYGFKGIPGHEFVGIAEEGPTHLLGRRVVGEINVACGDCATCHAGRSKHCLRRSVLGIRARHGAFAELVSVPAANLHLVPDGVSLENATFTEPLAAALDIPRRILIGGRDRVLVVGAGRLGQLVARVLQGQCAELDVIGRDPAKLERLPTGVGRLDEAEQAAYDVTIDCSGSPSGFALALASVRAEGTCVIKSTVSGSTAVDLTRAVVDEIRIVGSRCGPFNEALALLAGGLDLEPLVDACLPLRQGAEAFVVAGSPGRLKILVDARD